MFQQAVDIVLSGIATAFSWFEQLMARMPGAVDLLLSFFAIVVVSRFILSPLMGMGRASGSDKAKKSRNEKED